MEWESEREKRRGRRSGELRREEKWIKGYVNACNTGVIILRRRVTKTGVKKVLSEEGTK